jgi:hypothetical protein
MAEQQNQRRGLSLARLRFHEVLANVEQKLQKSLDKARLESSNSQDLWNGVARSSSRPPCC